MLTQQNGQNHAHASTHTHKERPVSLVVKRSFKKPVFKLSFSWQT